MVAFMILFLFCDVLFVSSFMILCYVHVHTFLLEVSRRAGCLLPVYLGVAWCLRFQISDACVHLAVTEGPGQTVALWGVMLVALHWSKGHFAWWASTVFSLFGCRR